jgi:hypothetical protein
MVRYRGHQRASLIDSCERLMFVMMASRRSRGLRDRADLTKPLRRQTALQTSPSEACRDGFPSHAQVAFYERLPRAPLAKALAGCQIRGLPLGADQGEATA